MKKDANKAINSPWFWAWVLLIIIVLSVNGVMVYFAYESNPGLVTDNYYERGQNYEQNMLKRQMNAPEWEMKISYPEEIIQNQNVNFILSRQQIEFDQVVFYAYRPADVSADFSKQMQLNSEGDYQVNISFSLKGKWDILVNAQKADKIKNQPLTIFVSE